MATATPLPLFPATSLCVCLALMRQATSTVTTAALTGRAVSDNGTITTSSTAEPVPSEGATFPRSLINDVTRQAIESVLHVGVIPVTVLCGVTLNVINMAVFARQGLSDHINVSLFSLAASDTGYMLFMMANRFGNLLQFISHSAAQYWAFQCLSVVGVYVAFLNTSNCLTVLIALERCVCVVWPLKARTIISDRTLRCLVVLAFLVSFLNNILFSFKFRVGTYKDPDTNATRYSLGFTHFYQHNRHAVDFFLENVNMVVPTASVIVVMATTALICVRMRSVLEWRQGRAQMTSSKEHREASVTRMLVVICVLYSLCTLPYVTHSLCRLVVGGFRPGGRLSNLANTTVGLVHAMLSLNAAANFLVYFTMSTRFRDTLHMMLWRTTTTTTTTTTFSSTSP